MAAKKSIKKNYLYNLAYQILLVIVPFATIPYLSRVLGVENIGINSFTLSIVAYFILLANIGVGSFGTREIALHQDDRKKYSKIFWDLYSYQFVIGIISILAYGIYVMCFGGYPSVQWIMMLNIVAAVIDMAWLYQGLEDYKYISIRNILIKLATVAATFIFVRTPDDLGIYVLINSISTIISSCILWFKFPKIADPPKLREIRIFRYWKDSIIYFLPQIAVSIYTVLDKTMLGIITGSEAENGYYEQTYKIIQIGLIIMTSLNAVVAPRMAYLFGKGQKEEIKKRLKTSFHFIYLLAFPLVFGLIALGPDFSSIFFGEGYEKVRLLLPIFAPIILIISISNCLSGQCIIPIGKQKQAALFLWIGAAVNFVLNIVLINMFSSVGAAISSIIAEIIITVSFIMLAREYMQAKTVFTTMKNYLIAGVVMLASLLAINYFWTGISLPIVGAKIAIGATIYFVVLRFILRDEFLKSEAALVIRKFLRR
ncbi:oligosaccharide flippase family protein [Candidatus Saccharibacteria bacterium]|jgi:O-antigen/teichoic acid export membrane protein|nr:oligosaccharide flippase family protein [Candidatus Saccharibacteria bacterium]